MADAEQNLKDALLPFIRSAFSKFFDHKEVFLKAVECLSELDCLAALASLATATKDGPMVRPVVHPLAKKGQAFMDLQQMRHPIVSE